MEEKQKLSRGELLAKARAAKAKKQLSKQVEIKPEILEETKVINEVKEEHVDTKEEQKQETKETKKPKGRAAKPKITKISKDAFEPKEEVEIIEEVVRVPSNKKKKIVKRILEIEESEEEEEVIEEIVKIPKKKNENKPSQVVNNINTRLMNELFS